MGEEIEVLTPWEEIWFEKGLKQGLEQGLEKGIKSGKVEVAKRLVLRKFGERARGLLRLLEEAEDGKVDEVVDRIFELTYEELEGMLKAGE